MNIWCILNQVLIITIDFADDLHKERHVCLRTFLYFQIYDYRLSAPLSGLIENTTYQ